MIRMASANQRIESVKGTVNAHKGHLTRTINAATKMCILAETDQSTVMVAKLEGLMEKLDAQMEAIDVGILELAGLDPAKQKDYEAEAVTEQNKYDACNELILKAVAKINKPPAQAAAVAPGAQNHHIKPNEALKPFTLTTEHNPVEFKMWIKKFKAYYQASNFESCPIGQQQAYLQACLDPKLEQRIQDQVDEDTPIFGEENSHIKLLEKDLLVRYPMFNRRLDFFKYNQAQDQAFSDFNANLKSKGDEADLHLLQPDDIYVFRYICGTTDKELKTRFLRLQNPTKENIQNEARAYESASSSLKAMANQVNKVGTSPNSGQGQRRGRSKSRNRNNGASKPQAEGQLKGKCYRCGRTNHLSDDCRKKLPLNFF